MELKGRLFRKLPRCAHGIPADQTCTRCGRRGDTPAQQAEDVITVQQVMESVKRDVEYFRGCFHGALIGALIGSVIGAVVVGAMFYFFG
jgi:hypothetical protein